jgi:type I restriction enzyme R subunit
MDTRSSYRLMLDSDDYTVMDEYDSPEPKSGSYESEAAREKHLIEILTSQGYEYLPIHEEADLIANLRHQLERLNGIEFTDKEWQRFFRSKLAHEGDGIVEKTKIIQREHVQLLERDDGTKYNIKLIDKDHVANNFLQIVNQYEAHEGNHENRYDVTILVNGLPLVHIELKRRGVPLREAFNQIDRYQRDSFWSGCGLYEYVQLFIISNGTHTKYYSNTTRWRSISEGNGKKKSGRKTSDSFEFTSYWTDARNKTIVDLVPFARTFLEKRTLLNILTRYCILTSEDILMVMRPYQIAATERVLAKIVYSENDKKLLGTIDAGGYVWHTTGSGKTLTSFKCSQLASQLQTVDRAIFVVDRKDLDYQTVREYDRFQKGAANSNTSTKILAKQLSDPKAKIIVTTIQKLATFIDKTPKHPVYSEHVVFIFDECHRSQFGDMHKAITKKFRNYHLFGFTGTPIMPENAPTSGDPTLRTTEQAFGKRLHIYTIINAINDGNVLPFRIDYIDTVQEKDNIHDEKVSGIDREKALLAPERIDGIVHYVLDHYDQKTKRSEVYKLKDRRVRGFNSIFATASIPAAKRYYEAFKRLQAEKAPAERLKIAIIYSYQQNQAEDETGFLADESMDTAGLDKTDRDFLDAAIGDYNEMFGTKFSSDGSGFDGYYKDISRRMKNRELDMLIVVNMFLTGFDATTLNTLWVDKNLKYHGLLQAFSRTNRILNSVKTFGNIVCFRDLSQQVDEALGLFSDENARGAVLLKPYREYLDQYLEKLDHLEEAYPPGTEPFGEEQEADFVKTFGAILRLRNVLTAWDKFEGENGKPGDDPIDPRTLQDYQSIYVDLYQKMRNKNKADLDDIIADLTFEIELVRQVEVNVDYILMLVEKYHASNCKDKTIVADIDRAVASSPTLRDKKDLIDDFVASMTPESNVRGDWRKFVEERKNEELDKIIEEQKLKPEETRTFVEQAFENGRIETEGTAITNIMKPMSRFAHGGESYEMKKQRLIERLQAFFERFRDIVQNRES